MEILGGVSRDGNAANISLIESAVTTFHVVYECPGTGSRGKVPNQVTEGTGTSKVEPPGMQVEDRLLWAIVCRMNPKSRDAPDGV
jgi:hypothetical protein